jgi:hypothetical protein
VSSAERDHTSSLKHVADAAIISWSYMDAGYRGETVCLVCCELDANRFVESLCPGWNDTEKLARLTVFDSNLELESNASTNHQIRYKAIPFELDDASGLSNTLQEEVDLEHVSLSFCQLPHI